MKSSLKRSPQILHFYIDSVQIITREVHFGQGLDLSKLEIYTFL